MSFVCSPDPPAAPGFHVDRLVRFSFLKNPRSTGKGTSFLRSTSFLDIKKRMWNYRSSSRSSIPQDRWKVSTCPPPEGEGVRWWSLSEVVLPGHWMPTLAVSQNGWSGPRLRPEPDQHTLCLQSLLHWRKEHRTNHETKAHKAFNQI